MKRAFEEINKSDVLIIEASEPSIGIGIEACYAYMNNIPVYLIANSNAIVSSSIKGISTKQIYYNEVSDLLELKEYVKSYMK
jgi:isochorismate hydrolase